MDKAAVLKIVRRYGEALRSRGIRANQIVLFGSHARSDSHEDSDIDLVVISDDFEGLGYWERLDILSKAICELFEPIEAVAMTPQEWRDSDSPLVQYAREGEVAYEA